MDIARAFLAGLLAQGGLRLTVSIGLTRYLNQVGVILIEGNINLLLKWLPLCLEMWPMHAILRETCSFKKRTPNGWPQYWGHGRNPVNLRRKSRSSFSTIQLCLSPKPAKYKKFNKYSIYLIHIIL